MALASAVLVVTVTVPAVVALQALDEFDDATAARRAASRIATANDVVQRLALDLETGIRGFVITGDETFLAPWERARRALPDRARELEALTKPGSRERELARALRARAERYITDYGSPLVELAQRDRDAASSVSRTLQGKQLIDELRALSAELSATQAAVVQRTSDEARQADSRARTALIVGLVLSILVVVAAGVYIFVAVSRPLRRLADDADRLGEGDMSVRARAEGGPREMEDLATAFNRMVVSLQQTQEQLERASQAKSDFLSRMSHELRTPLNAVLGFGQLLDMGELEEEDEESVRQILRAGQHLLTLIDEVLEISRIESGAMRISVEPVSIQSAIAETQSMVGPLAADRSITIEVAHADEEVFALADQQRVKQILLNLLSNAINYNRDGGSVMVETRVNPTTIRVLVRDTGPGMSKSQLEKLFVPFERLGAEQSEVKGTGLGLTLSQRLAEMMGGTLEVIETGSTGTTFGVTLPRAAPPEPINEPVRSIREAESDASGRLTVVYVEDNVSNFKLVQRIFDRHRTVRLLTAIQGSLGLELVRRHRPDLVLLDLHLPDMSGEQMLAQLKADPDLRDIPVIVVSADATSGQIKRLREAGAVAYLTKPFDVTEFLAQVERATAGEAHAH